MRVLLIEDSLVAARLVSELLATRAHQFRMDHVTRLAAGLERIRRDPPELLLLDLTLPDSQGFQTFLTAHEACGAEIPIIVLTGANDEELALRAMRAGAEDYLVKRFVDAQLLVKASRYAIERRQTRLELARRNREISTLHRISEISISSPTLETALGRFVEEIGVATGFPSVAIEMYDAERQVMRFMAVRGIDLPASSEVPVTQTLSGLVARSGHSLIECEALSRPEYSDPSLRNLATQTFICVPMRAEDRVIGTLSFGTPERIEVEQRFVQWVEGLADHIAALAERKRATEMVRQSERHFRSLIENALDLIVVLDHDRRARYMSPALARVLGYEPKDCLGRHALARVHASDRGALRERLAAVVQSPGSTAVLEFRHLHRDGSWRSLEGSAKSLLDDPAVRGIVINCRDASDRKHAEHEARESAARLRLLLEQMPALLWSTDTGLTLTSTLGAAAAASDPENLFAVGSNIIDLLRDHENAQAPTAHWRALQGESVSYQEEHRGRVYEAHVEPLRDPKGRVTGCIGAALDVTTTRRAEQRMRSLSEMLKALVQASPLAIVTLDGDSRVTSWSPAAERTFGWQADEVLGNYPPGIPSEHREEHLFLRQSVLRGESHTGIEMSFLDRSGRSLALRVSAAPLRDSDGRITGLAQFFEDVGERKRAERAIRRLASVPEQSPDPLFELDIEGNVLYLNAAARARFPDLQALGTLHPVLATLTPILARFRHGERKSFSLQVSADSAIFHQMVHFTPEGNLVRVFCRDVTEQNRAKQMLERETRHDRATGLANRMLLLERVTERIHQCRERQTSDFALLALDLDRLGTINDSLGHAAGDQLIAAVAARLLACVGPTEIVARLSGDEFALLLTDVHDPSDLARRAEAIGRSVGLPLQIEEQEIFPSVSIGIAPGELNAGAEYLLRDAHVAMHQAKSRGGSRHEIFDSSLQGRSLDRLRLGNDLRRAVEKDELRLVYQPIVRLPDGELAGFEALMRWPRQDGVVPPADFIPSAEESGLILPMSYRALDEIARVLAEWTVGEGALPIHFNVSARLLCHGELVNRIEACLRATGVEPARLVLEITESLLMEDAEVAAAALDALRALGVRVAVDDFGIGYSSLAYLHRFPVDFLKIDRSFVADLGVGGDRGEILRAILGLARGLHIAVIAEGVEQPEQLRILKALGCELAQGFLFSRPVDEQRARDMALVPPEWAGLRSLSA